LGPVGGLVHHLGLLRPGLDRRGPLFPQGLLLIPLPRLGEDPVLARHQLPTVEHLGVLVELVPHLVRGGELADQLDGVPDLLLAGVLAVRDGQRHAVLVLEPPVVVVLRVLEHDEGQGRPVRRLRVLPDGREDGPDQRPEPDQPGEPGLSGCHGKRPRG
jgi:hypothetical protein